MVPFPVGDSEASARGAWGDPVSSRADTWESTGPAPDNEKRENFFRGPSAGRIPDGVKGARHRERGTGAGRATGRATRLFLTHVGFCYRGERARSPVSGGHGYARRNRNEEA
ncbi:hypothetical protein Stube_67950 [Streptomyces tubercidicus]|uniref:Uncharacterized protein n=1 Tax=Streptomyces tubercidicus TaxID=47759 RepID=A0A640V3F8_9ACTN|nr:hypothetical protein Stube_67950 [Streptomyces tubercidicus]